MRRLPATLACLALGACLPQHAPAVRKVGMVSSIAGVIGLMGTALVQGYTMHTDDMLAGFSMMSGFGIAVFAYGEIYLPPPGPEPETETEKHRRWARILTTRASGAAREGRCPRVRKLEKRVNVYDREVHDFVFMRDAAILKCLGVAAPATDSVEADGARGEGIAPAGAAPAHDSVEADGPPPGAGVQPTEGTVPPAGTATPPAGSSPDGTARPVDDPSPPLSLPRGSVIPPTP